MALLLKSKTNKIIVLNSHISEKIEVLEVLFFERFEFILL
jgi:hypothetical protein